MVPHAIPKGRVRLELTLAPLYRSDEPAPM